MSRECCVAIAKQEIHQEGNNLWVQLSDKSFVCVSNFKWIQFDNKGKFLRESNFINSRLVSYNIEIMALKNNRIACFYRKSTEKRTTLKILSNFGRDEVPIEEDFSIESIYCPMFVALLENDRILFKSSLAFYVFDLLEKKWYEITKCNQFNQEKGGVNYHFLREGKDQARGTTFLMFISVHGLVKIISNATHPNPTTTLLKNHANNKPRYIRVKGSHYIKHARVLSDGCLLLIYANDEIWCSKSNVELGETTWIKYEKPKYHDFSLFNNIMELKNGLILDYNVGRGVFTVWNRKGESLIGQGRSILYVFESESGNLMLASRKSAVELALAYNKENLRNRCCYLLAKLVGEGIITTTNLSDHLPPELVELCVGFLEGAKSELEMDRLKIKY